MSNYVNISSDIVEAQQRELQEEKKVSKPRIEFNEKNYLQLRVGPGETQRTVTVRILPISATDGRAFFTMNTHSMKVNQEISKSGFKSFICLNDSNVVDDIETEGCPLCDKAKELYAQADCCSDEFEKKDLVKAASQYRAKRTFIVRVIERGKEDDGVKFWRFNEHRNGDGCYDMLMNLYNIRNNESINAGQGPFNIFDLKNGKDIVILCKYDAANRKTVYNITDAGFPTPLSTDDEKIAEWVNDPKTWRDIYSLKSKGYLEIISQGDIPFFDKTSGKWIAKKSAAETGTGNTVLNNAPMSVQEEEDTDFPF